MGHEARYRISIQGKIYGTYLGTIVNEYILWGSYHDSGPINNIWFGTSALRTAITKKMIAYIGASPFRQADRNDSEVGDLLEGDIRELVAALEDAVVLDFAH